MDTDRQAIERRDFPIARRGYDPASVDRHLAAVADTLERLRQQQSASGLSPATQELQAQINAVGRDLEHLLDSVRTGAARVAERMASVEANIPRVVGPHAPFSATPVPAAGVSPNTPLASRPSTGRFSASSERAHGPYASDLVAANANASGRAERSGDTEGARLVALDMALSGHERHEAAQYLAREYSAVDHRAVLDAVYASVG